MCSEQHHHVLFVPAQPTHGAAELLSLIRWREVVPRTNFDGLLTIGSKLGIPVGCGTDCTGYTWCSEKKDQSILMSMPFTGYDMQLLLAAV
jgi:hypothetical protein